MSQVLTVTGTVHEALNCVTNSAGQTYCDSTTTGLFAGFGVLLLFIYLAFAVLGIIAAVKVVTKAGYSGWWVLIAFVPIVGTVLMLIFAFAEWPVTREVKMLRTQLVGVGGHGRPGAYGSRPVSGGPPPTGPTPAPMAASEPTAAPAPLPTFGDFIQGGSVTPKPEVPVTPAAPTGQPAAGWYPAPGDPSGRQRYWDGSTWTEHFH
ncbi:MAG: DUF2510 domain-containing protein [Acidimicrobiales bacterium]